MCRKGFTLIELLVVIAIIAILAAMLMPALERARQAAKEAASVSQARQWGQIVQLYANDEDSMMPLPGNWFLNTSQWGWNNSFGISCGWCSDELRPWHDPQANKVAARDCRETIFGTLGEYTEAPNLWALPTDDDGGWDQFADGWAGPFHDRCQAGACSEETETAECWYSDDGVGVDTQHCEGWSVGMAIGIGHYWEPEHDMPNTVQEWRDEGMRLDQWQTNTYTRCPPVNMAGPDRAPDGLLFATFWSEAEGHWSGVHVPYRVLTASRANGEARVFHLHIPEGETAEYVSVLCNQRGWRELIMWQEGTHPDYPDGL